MTLVLLYIFTHCIYKLSRMCKLFAGIKRLKPSLNTIKIIYESDNYIVIDKYPVSIELYYLSIMVHYIYLNNFILVLL